MGGLGGDPSAMRRVAAHMEDHARGLEGDLSALQGQADAAFWKGADADAFRGRLADEHAAAVHEAAEAVRRAATRLREEAAQQEATSRG